MENTKNAIESSISAEAYINRGDKFYNQGNYEAAISEYNEAIHLNPNDARAYYNRGTAKSKLGKHFDAISDYDRAICLKAMMS